MERIGTEENLENRPPFIFRKNITKFKILIEDKYKTKYEESIDIGLDDIDIIISNLSDKYYVSSEYIRKQIESKMIELNWKNFSENHKSLEISSVRNNDVFVTNNSNKSIIKIVNNSIPHSSIFKDRSNLSKHTIKYSVLSLEKNMNDSINTNSISIGERLYRKSLTIKELNNIKTKELRNKNEKELKKFCTFKPNISLNSKASMSFSQYISVDKERKPRKNIVEYIKQKEENLLKEIKPTIRKPSSIIDKTTTRLYKEAERLEMNKRINTETYIKSFPFSPSIKRKDNMKPSIENFYMRLQAWKEKVNENYLKECEEAMKTKDGTPFFQPQISKYYETDYNIDIFSKLYDEHKINNMKKKEAEDKHTQRIRIISQSRLSTENAQKIYEDSKISSFEKLYDLLNLKGEDLIYYSERLECTISEYKLDSYLKPLVVELKDQKETLSKKEFMTAMSHLFDIYNVDQKRNFLNHFNENRKEKIAKKISRHSVNFPYRPKISEPPKYKKINLYSKNTK